jgi:hypothetical protein
MIPRSLLKSLGTELSKSILSLAQTLSSQCDHLAGQTIASLANRDLTLALLEPTFVLDALSLMRITKLASNLVSQFQELTLKLCQVSGNSKWAIA